MASIIEDLMNPGSLPDRTQNVTVVQTHISVVFVADKYVYKVKKPVIKDWFTGGGLKTQEESLPYPFSESCLKKIYLVLILIQKQSESLPLAFISLCATKSIRATIGAQTVAFRPSAKSHYAMLIFFQKL